MALIYGFVRAVAVALTKMAAWRHGRAQSQLEKADKAFREIETSCKAEEVASGRAADFASQFQLMKQYETREAANARWKRAAMRLAKRQKVSNWLADFSGKKIPYSFGLVDMALLMKVVEVVYERQLDLSAVAEMVGSYF